MDTDSIIVNQQREIEDLRDEVTRLKDLAISRQEPMQNSKTRHQPVDLIMENSNAVLFRRLAARDPKKRKMVYVSPNISRFGYAAEDFISGEVMFRDLVYHKDSPRTLKEIQEFTEQGIEVYKQNYRIVTKGGEVRWVEDRTSVYEDVMSGLRYHQGIVIDIHDRKTIEEKLKKSEEKHRRVIETTAEGFLFLDNDFVTADLNLAYERMVGLGRAELLGRKPIEITPDLGLYLSQTKETTGQKELEGELTNIHGQKLPVLIHIGSPISDTGTPLGVAAFITDVSSHKKALLLAAEVQQSLLPLQPPSVPGMDISGTSIPCDEVGGDYYDFLSGSENDRDVTVVVGDISGHGVDAALLMSSARSYLKACFSQGGSSEEIVSSLNRHLVEDMSDSGRFMTLLYLVLQKDGSSLEWIRAGHDPALLYDPILDSFSELKGPGVALGIDPTATYSVQRLDGLSHGQIIVLGTDGVWEAVNGYDEMFSKQRLKAIIRERQDYSAEQILQKIIFAHKDFTTGTIPTDDLTIIIIKV